MFMGKFDNNFAALTNRLPSPAVWQGCPAWADIREGVVDAIYDGDDFHVPTDEDGNDIGGYERYIDTSNTIRTLATDTTALATGSRGGVMRLLIDASDNDGPVIQRTTANGAGMYLIGNTAGATWPFYFECRLRVTSIVDDVIAIFAGLCGVDAAKDDGVLADNTGDIVDSISALGFRSVHVNSGTAGTNALVDFAYQDSAQTAPTVPIAAAHTFVASTWVKLGFNYDPRRPAAKKIKAFVNNVEQSTYITTTNIDTSTFPENDAMCITFAAKAGSATASNLDIDWWHCVQVYDDQFGAA